MNLKRSIILFLLCIISCTLSSQNVYIKGTVEKANQKKIRFSKYNDQISFYEEFIAEYSIKNDMDTFTFSLSVNYPTPVILKMESYSREFLVEPNRTYEIFIPEFDWSMDEKINIHLNPVNLPVVFNNLETEDLNLLIDQFNNLYTSALKKHELDIFLRRNPQALDTLLKEVYIPFDSINNSYFNIYKRYKMASIEFAMNIKSKQSMGLTYFHDQPILYSHIGYMDFFNLFFNGFFINGTKHIKPYQIKDWIRENNLFTFLDSLGTEPLLQNEQFRELVFLKGMNEAYFSNTHNHLPVTKMLTSFIETTKFEEHKKMAQGIISQHDKTAMAEKVLDFRLPDINKTWVSLDTFRGKWVYLNFVRLKEAPSLRELASLSFYHDSICNIYNIEFVTICCDREFQRMFHFLKNSKDGDKYNWTWMHFNNNYDLLDAFQVKMFPFFVLINPEGEIVSMPEKSPQQGFFINPHFIDKHIKDADSE